MKHGPISSMVQKFYGDFIEVPDETLYELVLAANYMDIKPLLDLTCATVANSIKGKTPQEVRDLFGLKNEFTEEEEAWFFKESSWTDA
jgi:S-phase kinase-associated protein 1